MCPYFNPRTREGCDCDPCHAILHVVYFNPRTREGCDESLEQLTKEINTISIHAPVKGATPDNISLRTYGYRHFNPRTREGCDSDDDRKQLSKKIISIHAPVKGATRSSTAVNSFTNDISIHAPVKGATGVDVRPAVYGCIISIHAPVKGATKKNGCKLIGHGDFNPRTREGCDGIQND